MDSRVGSALNQISRMQAPVSEPNAEDRCSRLSAWGWSVLAGAGAYVINPSPLLVTAPASLQQPVLVEPSLDRLPNATFASPLTPPEMPAMERVFEIPKAFPPFIVSVGDSKITVMPEILHSVPTPASAGSPATRLTLGGGRSYDLLKQVGKGHFGKVYRGHDHQTQREVAIKVVYCKRSGRSLRSEIIQQVRCQGPHIMPLIDAAEFRMQDGGKCFVMVMPRAKMELYDWVYSPVTQLGRKLAPAVVMNIVRQLAIALERIHARKLIHHDIKLENILVTDDEGDYPQVDLADFGLVDDIARSIDGYSNCNVGTDNYRAPEIDEFGGIGHDQKVDIFSLGVVTYTLLKGHHPYRDKGNRLADIQRHQGRPLWPLEGVPANLVELVHDMLRYDAALRPTASSVLNRINAMIARA